jgi:H+/gluconate symporter-like permease
MCVSLKVVADWILEILKILTQKHLVIAYAVIIAIFFLGMGWNDIKQDLIDIRTAGCPGAVPGDGGL